MRALPLALLLACGRPAPVPTPAPAQATCPEAASPAADATAADLASQGRACLDAQRLPEARALLTEAIARDPDLAVAHLDRARTLARQRRGGDVCDLEAWFSEVLDEAVTATRLDPSLRARLADPDFDEARRAIRFQVAAGVDLTDPAQLAAAVAGLTVHSPGNGAYGSTNRVEFAPDGALTHHWLDFGASEGEYEPPRWTSAPGTWRLEGVGLYLSIEEDGPLTVLPTGRIMGPGDEGLPRWVDAASECEA